MTPAEKENQELKARLKKALERNEELEEMVRQLQRMIFGKKTEKFETVVKGQGSLFDDEQLAALVDSDIDLTETEVTEIEVIEKKKVVRHQERKNSQGRAAFLDSLPQVEELTPLEDTQCPTCQHEMNKIGKRVNSREVELIPPQLRCINHCQETYKCQECEKKTGETVIKSSKTPQLLLPHSLVSGSILAEVANYKFNLAVPIHRQKKIWERLGLPVNKSSLVRSVISVSETYLEPLVNLMTKEIRKEPVVHMDETPIKVLDEPSQRGYLWVIRTTKEFSKYPIIQFNYRHSRKGKTVEELVGDDYRGIIECDDYVAYNEDKHEQIKFGACLVHIRRWFINIIKDSRKILKKSLAIQIVKRIGKIFEIEQQLEYETKEEKLKQRILRLKPAVDEFFEFLKQVVHKTNSKLRTHIESTLKLEPRVYRIFEDGQVPLSNNDIEQSIRFSTIIRKNSLFAQSVAGAKACAVYYSLVETAKENNLDVVEYFRYLFKYLPNRIDEDLTAYLPWAKQVQVACHK